MSLFSELKRRNVFRVSAAYAVVGWLFLQVSDVVLDFTEAPAWIGKVIIALLVLGFFVALILSWLFDITPDGIRRDDGGTKVDRVRAERLNILTIAAAIGVAAMFAWQQLRGPESTASTFDQEVATAEMAGSAEAAVIDDASIAVLPFADLSPNGDQEYFSDGIAEEILNVLAAIDELAVASRTSAFAFKGQDRLGIPAIGEALKVRHVLEGSVRSAGDTIRITAQLIDARTDKHLWSQTYDRTLSAETIFEIQDEIASSIVAELAKSLQLEGLDREQVSVRADTQDLDAYQLFLRGRQRFRVRSVNNIPGTIVTFQRAVTLDPTFARAWSGLAAVNAVAPSWGITSEGDDFFAIAERAARKAIELEDSLSMPYAVLGYLRGQERPTDYVAIFDLYEEALKRDPRETSALLWRGNDKIALGFFDDAIADLDHCHEIDPGYENCVVFGSLARLYSGDLEGAIKQFEHQAGSNSPSQALPIAIALTTNGSRFEAMLGLAWAAESFQLSIKPRVIYRALTEPNFDAESELRGYIEEQVALTGEIPDLTLFGGFPALIFRRYDEMVPSLQNMFWWQPGLTEFRASPHRNRLIRELGIYDFWRASGFPPQCRPIGDDDFECD
jgi:TolB-like protein